MFLVVMVSLLVGALALLANAVDFMFNAKPDSSMS